MVDIKVKFIWECVIHPGQRGCSTALRQPLLQVSSLLSLPLLHQWDLHDSSSENSLHRLLSQAERGGLKVSLSFWGCRDFILGAKVAKVAVVLVPSRQIAALPISLRSSLGSVCVLLILIDLCS